MSRYILLTAVLFILTAFPADAEYRPNPTLPVPSDPQIFVCDVLGSLGIGCGNSAPQSYQPGSAGIIGPATSTAATQPEADSSPLTASVLDSANGRNKNEVVLVNVRGTDEIYVITGGKKRLIPTMDIFYDYNYKAEMVQNISKKELDKFPRVTLIQPKGGSKNIFYLTESGTIRSIPKGKIFESYGNRKEDVVVISKKEFNYYPRNQFVFLENPMNRDVYQIVDGKTKRYLTPVAVRRMNIARNQISPINEFEFDFYRTEKPIVM